MNRVEVRDLGEPEAVVTYPLGASSQVRLGGTVVTRLAGAGRSTLSPWSTPPRASSTTAAWSSADGVRTRRDTSRGSRATKSS
jgi:hypothetical protein